MRNQIVSFLLGVLLSFGLVTPGLAQKPVAQVSGPADIAQAFKALHRQTIWPVQGSTRDDIESTFGPRLKASTADYDWHRGMDIDAALGAPVLAVTSGTLWDVTTYPDGGLTVILKHTFNQPVNFQNVTINSFYTFSMHLDEVDPTLLEAAQLNQYPTVLAGQQLGTVGHSGTALGDHLHFEVLAGTWCSLEYQLSHSTSSCAVGFGYDPAVHPLLLFPAIANELSLIHTTEGARVTENDDQPDWNRLEITVQDRKTRRVAATHVLDLNQRLGFDASSTATLDSQDLSKPYLSPESFGPSATLFSTKLVIPAVFTQNLPSNKYLTTVKVFDIWGGTRSVIW